MTDEIVTNILFVRAQAGRALKLEEALRELARETREEPGNLVYEVHRSASERDEYLVYAIWRSQGTPGRAYERGGSERFPSKGD